MDKKFAVLIINLIILICLIPGWAGDFSSPRATLETFFQAVRDRDKELCAACLVNELRQEMLENWDESELPGEFEYEIQDVEIKQDKALVKIKLVSDEYGEETEELSLIKDPDGWKITMDDYDDFKDIDTCRE